MTAAEMHHEVEKALYRISAECERGIVGDRTIDGVPIAAYARIAPNCLLYCQPIVPEQDIFIDFCLN